MVDTKILAAFEAGRAAYPASKFDLPSFARRVAELDVREEDMALRPADLFLAWSCAQHDPAALASFEQRFLQRVSVDVGRMGLDDGLIDEVRQELRIRLLIGQEPRIAQYTGRGALAAWVRIAAVRSALTLIERNKKHPRPAEMNALRSLVGDETSPELAALRHRYGGAFQAGLERSLEALEPRDKTLLRMHFIDQLNIDMIGRIYRVHRATAARWLVAIRRQVLESLRKELALELRAGTSSEFRSLLAVLRSDLDISLRHVLKGDGESTSP